LFALLLALFNLGFAQETSQIAEIELRGFENVNKEQIVALMRTKVGQPYIQAQLDQDKRAIEDLGFFRAVDVTAQEQGNQTWKVVVQVSEFPKIKEVRLVGNSVVSTADIMKILETVPAIPIAPGHIYNLKSARPTSDAIEKLYTDKGFFCRVGEFGPLQDSLETINIVLIELTVNQVYIQGNKRTRRSVLDRVIRTEPGKAFNTEVARQDYRRLFETQWFEDIKIIDRQTEDPGKIDLIFDVKEGQTGQLNFGAQIDPRSNIAGLLRYGDSNFRGTGQSVGINLVQGSKGGTSIDLDYGNPYFDDRGTTVNGSIYSRVQYRFSSSGLGGIGGGGDGTEPPPTPRNDEFYERRTGASFGMARRWRDTAEEALFGSLAVKFENIKTSSVAAKTTNSFIQQDGDIAALSFGVTRDKRDVAIDASRGDWARISIEPGYANITKVAGTGTSPAQLGAGMFMRGSFEYRRYFTNQAPRDRTKLDDPRRVLAVRLRAGTVSGKVPFFEQFFVGGADSLRGYAEDRFWGNSFAVGTIEYRIPVQKSFNAALFADFGSAWGGYGSVGTFAQSTKPEFKIGYGVGFSFRTPLGPIRLDFGFNDKGGSRTHFLIGTSF
jgi:outer membrane protein insertion porin family